LNLPFGLTFADLYHRNGLVKLDQAFLNFLQTQNQELFFQYTSARQGGIPDESALLLSLASLVDQFVGALFDGDAAKRLHDEHQKLSLILEINRQFVQRVAIKKYPKTMISLIGTLKQALQVYVNLQDEQAVAMQISIVAAEKSSTRAWLSSSMRPGWLICWSGMPSGTNFVSVPGTDLDHLVPVEIQECGSWQLQKPTVG
jgi:hypothetical protein